MALDDGLPALQFVVAEAEGYCDPVTGVCYSPGDEGGQPEHRGDVGGRERPGGSHTSAELTTMRTVSLATYAGHRDRRVQGWRS